MDYQHMRCDSCGGIIGMYDRKDFTCEKCGKEFILNFGDYDKIKN